MIAYLKSGLRRTLCLSLLTFISVYSMAQDTDDYSPDAPVLRLVSGLCHKERLIGKLVSYLNGTEETVDTHVLSLSTHLCFVLD